MTIFTDEEVKEFIEYNKWEGWVIVEALLDEFKEKLIKRRDGVHDE